MRILHYFLGFPPYRTGGLTKFAFDLMTTQVSDGHEVMALWPGEIKRIGGKPRIRERKSVHGIKNYELVNPLPVSLDEGINDFEAYTKPCDEKVYFSFLQSAKPDVIHIHTLMGMHREFIKAANHLKIRTVMTSHDYFGFCPKVTLYRYGKCCDNDNGCRNCIQCNLSPLSLRTIQLMQSPLYRMLKNASIVKKLREQHRGNFFGEEVLPDLPDVNVEGLAEKYRKLRAYYVEMYESIDFIHFNSTVAEEIYERYMIPKDSKVISITHRGIKDNRENGHINSDKFRILCLAPAKPFKGFNVLKEALDQLWDEGNRYFELRIYSPVQNTSPYMVIRKEGYKYEDLSQMMKEADIVVAASIWYETFGFTVVEALSYAVPVIVSDHMGAKDIVGDSGIVVKAGNALELKNSITELFKNDTIKRNVLKTEVKPWEKLVADMYGLYKGIR